MFFFIGILFAYLEMRNSYTGEIVKWAPESTIDFYLTGSSRELSFEKTFGILENSLSNHKYGWGDHDLNINLNIKAIGNFERTSEINEIQFASNYIIDEDLDIFAGNNAIVGITEVVYHQGVIKEADITFNDNFRFNNDINSLLYLGNAATHEFGHALGLSHSQVYDSSMNHSLKVGQYSVSDDDVWGIRSLYGQSHANELIGRVVGGDNVPVFGADVQFMSLRKNKIIAGTVTDNKGEFRIKNLDKNDAYFIYVTPLLSGGHLPYYYSATKSNYCDKYKSYIGSFYADCQSGRPHPIIIGNAKFLDIGVISIACNLKGVDNREEFVEFNSDNFLGTVLKHEGVKKYRIDISKLKVLATGKLKLNFNLLSHDFYSLYLLDVVISGKDFISYGRTNGSGIKDWHSIKIQDLPDIVDLEIHPLIEDINNYDIFHRKKWFEHIDENFYLLTMYVSDEDGIPLFFDYATNNWVNLESTVSIFDNTNDNSSCIDPNSSKTREGDPQILSSESAIISF